MFYLILLIRTPTDIKRSNQFPEATRWGDPSQEGGTFHNFSHNSAFSNRADRTFTSALDTNSQRMPTASLVVFLDRTCFLDVQKSIGA